MSRYHYTRNRGFTYRDRMGIIYDILKKLRISHGEKRPLTRTELMIGANLGSGVAAEALNMLCERYFIERHYITRGFGYRKPRSVYTLAPKGERLLSLMESMEYHFPFIKEMLSPTEPRNELSAYYRTL